MVKRQKEKQYQSFREHRANSQLRAGTSSSSAGTIRRLPFNCCALSLTPYTSPVCHPTTGIIFDNASILPHLLKHKTDPVTGNPMTSRDLITLHMDKDSETGKWQCPVLNKPFTDHTKIVAVIQQPPGTEANVYSYEAIQELNIKPKNYVDLISGKKFHRTKDVIVLQDPENDEQQTLRDIGNFKHIATMREEEKNKKLGSGGLVSGDVRHSVTASRIMDKIKRKREEDSKEEMVRRKKAAAALNNDNPNKKPKIYTNALQGQSMTSGKCSGSFTSTSVNISNTNDIREATSEEILQSLFYMMKRRKQKGFVRLQTSLGILDLEIHADIAPRTSMNFLGLVEKGEYDGSVFHRSIRNFMIQGGKPGKKEVKEESLWGGSFEDEFDDRLVHSGHGIVSMANAGPSTNKRQFFITYKSAPHLDRKHSVFGRVVKGLDILKSMEQIPTDKKDKPKQEIKIIQAEILGPNPIMEAQEEERVRIEERSEKIRREKEERKASALGKSISSNSSGSAKQQSNDPKSSDGSKSSSSNSGIGKYLPKDKLQDIDTDTPPAAEKEEDSIIEKESKKKKKKKKKKTGEGSENNLAAMMMTSNNNNVPSRLPPPPKKTTFGDFSGW